MHVEEVQVPEVLGLMLSDNCRDLDPSLDYSDDALPFPIYRVREWHKFPGDDLETG